MMGFKFNFIYCELFKLWFVSWHNFLIFIVTQVYLDIYDFMSSTLYIHIYIYIYIYIYILYDIFYKYTLILMAIQNFISIDFVHFRFISVKLKTMIWQVLLKY